MMYDENFMALYKTEILKVKALGDAIGYGNLMDIASVLYRKKYRM